MSHLCQEAGIQPKIVWQWMNLFYKDNENIVAPSKMCEYFLKPLQLQYKEITEIKKKVEENEMLSFAPRTLIAACTYLFLRNVKKRCKLSVQKISNLLGVSFMSVYRCINALNKKNDL